MRCSIETLAHGDCELVVNPAVRRIPEPGVAVLSGNENVCGTGGILEILSAPRVDLQIGTASSGRQEKAVHRCVCDRCNATSYCCRPLRPVRRYRVQPDNASRAGARFHRVEHFLAVRKLTEQLAAPLSPEDQTSSDAGRQSDQWHLAHTTWFFETFRAAAARGTTGCSIQPTNIFQFLLRGGGPRIRAATRMITRPGVEEIRPIGASCPTRWLHC